MEKLNAMVDEQLKMELKGTITVKSVERKDGLENLSYYVSILSIDHYCSSGI